MLTDHLDAGNGSCIDVSVSLDARDASDIYIEAIGIIDACDGNGESPPHPDTGGSRSIEMQHCGGVLDPDGPTARIGVNNLFMAL